ncbi:MAG: hypothetical protein KDA85_12100 [Planctomycetaceae bacterium]|nr:hypothetical protein [Planctomycetaceae bacterium]
MEQNRGAWGKYGLMGPLAAVGLLAMLIGGIIVSVQSSPDAHATASVANVPDWTPVVTMTAEELQNEVQKGIEAEKQKEAQRREQFAGMIPAMVSTSLQQAIVAGEMHVEINGLLYEMANTVDADNYADMICGWESTFNRFDGESAHVDWMMHQFHTLVLDQRALTQILNDGFAGLHESCNETDAALLTELGLDIPVPCEQLEVPTIDLSWMDDSFRIQVQNSAHYLGQAWGEWGASYAAGELASSFVENLIFGARDPNGSDDNAALRFVTNQAADLMFGKAFESAISTSREELATEVETLVRQRLSGLLDDAPDCSVWMTPMQEIVFAHRQMMADQIIQTLQVDRDWAIGALNDYCDRVPSQENAE